jgi:hypothetical protein
MNRARPSFRFSSRSPTPDRLRFGRRGGSAPRGHDDKECNPRNGNGREERRPVSDEHSKSLPPRRREEGKGGKTEEERENEKKEKAEKDEADFQVKKTFIFSSGFFCNLSVFCFQARLKLLPSPDREKVLARRKKFQAAGNKPVEATVGKKISLKAVNTKSEERDEKKKEVSRRSRSPRIIRRRREEEEVEKKTELGESRKVLKVGDARRKIGAKKGKSLKQAKATRMRSGIETVLT